MLNDLFSFDAHTAKVKSGTAPQDRAESSSSSMPPSSSSFSLSSLLFISLLFALLWVVVSSGAPSLSSSSVVTRPDPRINVASGSGEMRVDPVVWLSRCMMERARLLEVEKLLRTVSEVIESMNLTYWLDGSTALGALRLNAVLPYDDDADLCMFLDDFQQHKNELAQRLEVRGVYPQHFDGNPELHLPKMSFSRRIDHKHGAVLDIFLVRRAKKMSNHFDLVVRFFNMRLYCKWPHRVLFAERAVARLYDDTDDSSSAAVPFQVKTKYGYLGRARIVGRDYPVPADLDGYLACEFQRDNLRLRYVWNSPHQVASRWCSDNTAETYDIRRWPGAAMLMLMHTSEAYGKESYDLTKTVTYNLVCSNQSRTKLADCSQNNNRG